MAKSLDLTTIDQDSINLTDESIIVGIIDASSNIRVSYIDKDAGRPMLVIVTAASFTAAITGSFIITVTNRGSDTLYVNANRISLIEEDNSLAKITVNLADVPAIYLLDETVAAVNGLIDGAGGSGTVTSVFGRTGAVTAQNGDYTAAQVGLGNVDNTSDANKPVSTAQQTALDGKLDLNVNIITEATTARTILTADNGAQIDCTNASATTITLPPGFSAGFQAFVTKEGTGNVVFAPGASVTINSVGLTLATQYTGGAIISKGSNTWNIYGPLT